MLFELINIFTVTSCSMTLTMVAHHDLDGVREFTPRMRSGSVGCDVISRTGASAMNI